MNKNINVKLKKLRDNAKAPKYGTAEAAACDLCACLDANELELPPHKITMIPCGIAIECERENDENLAILVFARSGLASKHGIGLANGVGVIDTDYRGEVKVPLINQLDEPYVIHDGDRIAQMMFVPVLHAEFEETDELSETERGKDGFGSTGKN